MNSSIPKWIYAVSGAMSLLGVFVGCSLYFSPGTFIPNVDFSLAGSRYLAHMWAARQIAIAAIIGYSLIRRSVPMLKVSLLGYCLMNIQDVLIGVSTGDKGLMIGALIAFLLPASMIFVLSKAER